MTFRLNAARSFCDFVRVSLRQTALCQSSDPTSVTIQHGGLKLCDKVLFQNLNQASVLILQSYFRRAGKVLQHYYPPLWATIDDRVANV